MVAGYEGKTVAEYLSELLRPLVERDAKRIARKTLGKDEPPAGS
jgi:hypothetical protein